MIVLWGARRGDVIYATPAFWNQHLPVGVATIELEWPAFRYGD